jgi:UDP-glucose 4-epimerase
MNKILILGADGFIGSNLIKALLSKEERYFIRAFDLFRNDHLKNLEDMKDKIEIFPGDFLNKNDLEKALNDIDYVFHFISLTTPISSYNDPIMDVETNVYGTINLLEKCVKHKIKKIIFSSSGGAIYGDQEKEKLSEKDLTNPISPYAISKLTVEKYLEFYRIHSGLDYLILRYGNPYGSGQDLTGSQGIIPIFLNLVKNDKNISVFGDGESMRDYIYIDDLVENTIKIFEKNNNYRVYNIGSGIGKSINEVIALIKQCSHKNIKIKKYPARESDVKRVVLNIERIKLEVDYRLETSLEKGIEKTWNWLNNKK